MKHTLACRPGFLGLSLSDALTAIKHAGVDNVELDVPTDGDFKALAAQARAAGLTITSLSCGWQVDEAASGVALGRAIAGAREIGVPILFVAASIDAAKTTYEQGVELLRAPADEARRAGVVLSLETHVPFAHNGDIARKTVAAVNSPGLGFNYDSANLYFYNPRGISGVAELIKTLPMISSVHLKESLRGEPESWDFPVFGEGIVDFRAIFDLLDAQNYSGPFTMELEGPLVETLPTAARVDKLRGCVAHLRGLGVL